MNSRPLFALLPLLALVACNGDEVADSGLVVEADTDTDTDADTDTDTDADADADTDTDTDTDVEGFTVEGTGMDVATFSPAAEGLCMHAIDPTNALIGAGDPDVFGSAVLDSSAAFSIAGIVYTDSRLMLLAQDCADEGTVMPTATGIDPDSYAGIEDGGVISDRVAASVSVAMADGVDESLAAVGWAGGSVHEVGMVVGFVQDASRAPIEGATVSCTLCTVVYYMDADASDGLFSTAGEVNTTTSAAAGGIFVVPDAPLTQYSADDGSSTFPSHLFGGFDGATTVISLIAEE